jgi:arabinogalactan oligomer / maltooligosaccharide transport system permease protein
MMKNMKSRERFGNGIIYAVLSFLSFIWLLPIVWLVLVSFRAEPGAYTDYIFPKTYTLDNYIKLFTETQLFNYPRWFMNTLIVAIITCVVSTIIVLLTSYALSRLRFKLRKPMMNVALVLGMFPGFMSMIAVYHILKAFGLTQTLFALVLVYSGGAALGYYISKGFFDTIPKSIDESAMLDGASKNTIFWKITLPLSKPIVVYTILTSFIAPWMDFIFVSVIMKDNYENYTVALGLFQMLSRENIYQYFTRFAAGAVLIAIPITLLFIYMQKYYISGITGGSVKG